jgi:hypothetical protein
MRISQDAARQAANKLTANAEKNVDALRKEFSELVKKYYIDSLPKGLMEMAGKFSEYFHSVRSIYLNSHGFNRLDVDVEGEVPAKSGWYHATFDALTPKTADILKKAHNKYVDAKKEYEALVLETKTALLNLKTTKRIAEELPIALAHIASGMPQYPVPALNLKSLKVKLAKLQPKTEKKTA